MYKAKLMRDAANRYYDTLAKLDAEGMLIRVDIVETWRRDDAAVSSAIQQTA